MKKNKIKKELKYHKKWLKSIIKDEEGPSSSKVRFAIEAEIRQLTWIIKMFDE